MFSAAGSKGTAFGGGRGRGSPTSLLVALLAVVLLAAAAIRFGAVRAEPPLETLASSLLVENDRRPILLYVFQREDCSSFGALFEEWAALDRSGALRAVGVGLRFPRTPEARGSALDTAFAGFPVDFDLARNAERLLLRLGFRSTPVALLLDGEGRLRLAVPLRPEPGARRRAVEVVREHALRLMGEALPPERS